MRTFKKSSFETIERGPNEQKILTVVPEDDQDDDHFLATLTLLIENGTDALVLVR
jgi:hypothetical protein